jgi:sarcosine/dimethylglycine N-methyltransferase
VLELGCGLGTILIASQQWVQSRETYVGIDLSYEMIRRARVKRCQSVFPGQIEFLLSSAIALPFRDGSFNVVLLSHLVKYLTDIQLGQVMSEARRVLNDAGRIVLWEFKPFISRRVSKLIAEKVGAQKLRSAEEIRQSLEAAGFWDLTPFRIVTPWVPWQNVALRGRTFSRPTQGKRA